MKQVGVLGFGAMGTVITNLLASNIIRLDGFNKNILWYVRDEEYNGERLVNIICKTRVNSKYAPKVKLRDNITVNCSAPEVAAASDVLFFIVNARFVLPILGKIKRHVKPHVLFVSLSKGLIDYKSDSPSLNLISEVVLHELGVKCVVVSGAYNAKGLINGDFAEATVGSTSKSDGAIVQQLLTCDNLMLTWTDDACTVEVCAALKNILAVAAGIIDGLGLGANTKSAIIRLGLYEIGQYRKFMYGKYEFRQSALLESCGASELFLSILHKTNELPAPGDDFDFFNLVLGRRLTEKEYTKMNSTAIQKSLHPDLVASGPDAAKKVNKVLHRLQLCEQYPLFTAVHLVCERSVPPDILIHMLQYHPAHA